MLTGADVIEDPMKRRAFLLKEANKIIKIRPSKEMSMLRHELRREGKNINFYLPIMQKLAEHIQVYYMLKES